MSAKKMFGDLPPSSSVAGIRLLAAAWAMTRPVAVEVAADQVERQDQVEELEVEVLVFSLYRPEMCIL